MTTPRPYLSGNSYREPTGAAVLDSIEGWGNYAAGGFPALAWAHGLGLLTAPIRDGELHAAEAQPRVDPTSYATIEPALERGDAWSSVFAAVLEDNRQPLKWISIRAWFPGGSQGSANERGFYGLGPFESVSEIEAPSHFGVVYSFAHPPAHVLAALGELEQDARDTLKQAEPGPVRMMRDEAAAAGRPITLELARERFARAHGLSATEAAQLRRPATMDQARLTRITRSNALLRSFGAIAGQPIETVRSAPVAADAPAPMAHQNAYIGGALGVVVGGVLGRVVAGSWTGAAVGAGLGALAGGGVAYAMEPSTANASEGAALSRY